jgi:adenylate cyclase
MAERAIELDSQYAAAYALLSLTHQVEWMWHLSEDPQQSLARATELAQRAVTLDGSLPVARWILGWCYVYQRQYEQAIAEGEQAISLGPNDAEAHLGLAEILNWAGRPEEALRLTEKAMRLNPRYFLSLAELGHAYYLMGRNEEAMAAFKRVLSHCPDCLGTRSWLASIYVELGREEEARAQVAEILQRNPNFSTEGVLSTYKDQAQAARLRNALHKAGLK